MDLTISKNILAASFKEDKHLINKMGGKTMTILKNVEKQVSDVKLGQPKDLYDFITKQIGI